MTASSCGRTVAVESVISLWNRSHRINARQPEAWPACSIKSIPKASMSETSTQSARAIAEFVYRAESRRVFATLVRLLGDFDIAEEALHDAFHAALEQWPRDGVPANPRAWLVSTGRFKAIDGIRRRARFDSIEDFAEQVEHVADESQPWEGESIEDDRLRLIFTCCHPALSSDA